jgi:ParB family chromosome partitioning protein
MRRATDAPAHRYVPVIDRQQPGLFGEDLPGPGPQAVEDVRGDDAGTRRVPRRAVQAGREPTDGEPLQVPIDQLDDDPLHPRAGYPQECLDDLAKDIAERGILQAIVVAPPDARGRYRIRFGVQRWRAARLAGLTLVPVAVRTQPCQVYDQVAENLKRHGLSPLELARFIRSRFEAGESNATIAKKLAVDQTTVAHHLTLLELPPVLSAALESGRCTSPRTLHELQKLHAERPDAVAALLAGDLPVTRGAVAAVRTSAARPAGALESRRGAPGDRITSLISRSQALCDQLERLLALLADTGPNRLPGEPLVALRHRLVALAQRLDG